jgi:hypothetical protein
MNATIQNDAVPESRRHLYARVVTVRENIAVHGST